MAQPFEQSSKSLWGLEQVLEKQRGGDPNQSDFEMEEDEFGAIPDEAFMSVDLTTATLPPLPMVAAH